MPLPTWRLAAVAAAGSVVVLLAVPAPVAALLGVNAVVLLAAVADGLRAGSPRRFAVTREVPAVLPMEQDATLRWTVADRSGRGGGTRRVRLADALAPSLRAGDRRAVVDVPAGGRAAAATTLRPSRRGRFLLADVAVRVEGPWRLVARQSTRSVPLELRVLPLFRSREEAELRVTDPRRLEIGLRSAKGRGGGTEFDQLREYSVDDEFRRIDWSATARAGKPIVRTYRAERNQHLIVLLDTGRSMAARVRDPSAGGAVWGDVPRLDHAMDAVMTLTAVSTRLGDRAGLLAYADAVRAVVPPGANRDQLRRVTDALVELEPELVESDHRAAFAETLTRFRRRGLLVVLTELAPEQVAETLVPALPLVLRSHLVLIGAVRDPSVDRWARSVPGQAATAYRKAAAVSALDDRARTVARLRSMGAVVVDEPPGRLAPRLADAYLDMKARSRL
jgi:uncharacterized protein (DUF58 family)